MDEQIESIIDVLKEISEENTLPKNVRDKLHNVVLILKEDGELSLQIDKALGILENISDDNNLQAYTRTQIWNIISMLEMNK